MQNSAVWSVAAAARWLSLILMKPPRFRPRRAECDGHEILRGTRLPNPAEVKGDVIDWSPRHRQHKSAPSYGMKWAESERSLWEGLDVMRAIGLKTA